MFSSPFANHTEYGFTLNQIKEALSKSQAAISFKPDGTIIHANENFLKGLGYTLEEVVGKHHRIFCEEYYVQSNDYKMFWESLAQGEYHSGKFKRIGSDGQEVFIQATYNPILNNKGQVVGVIKMATDITIPVQKEREAVNRTQASISFTPEGIITDVNDTFLNALGYTHDEVIGQHHKIFCDAEYANTLEYKEFWSSLAQGHAKVGDFKRIRKDGTPIYIHAAYNPNFGIKGEVVGVTKYATDITQARKIKEEAGQVADASAQAIEELSSSVMNIVSSMSSVRQSTESVSQSINHTENVTSKLAEAAENMTNIVEIIKSISDQIDLLALNAAIEAARAGDAGRGFAVVADEVKKLAAGATESTTSIVTEISLVQSIASDISDNISSIVQQIHEVQDKTSSVVDASEHQSSVVNHITSQVTELANSVRKL